MLPFIILYNPLIYIFVIKMLSYSGLVTYGKTSLPSVESWNTNNNIVRDPPRSFMTRRKTKVSDTSEILATLAESDDRFCKDINTSHEVITERPDVYLPDRPVYTFSSFGRGILTIS